MPEADSSDRKQFHADILARHRAFQPPAGRTVMLAIDHGYFQVAA